MCQSALWLLARPLMLAVRRIPNPRSEVRAKVHREFLSLPYSKIRNWFRTNGSWIKRKPKSMDEDMKERGELVRDRPLTRCPREWWEGGIDHLISYKKVESKKRWNPRNHPFPRYWNWGNSTVEIRKPVLNGMVPEPRASPDCFDKDLPFLCTSIPLSIGWESQMLVLIVREPGKWDFWGWVFLL